MLQKTLVPQKLFGVVGYPLGHSLSPLLHNWGFSQINRPYVYFSWPVSPDYLPRFILSLETLPIHGASVTIPHKQNIIPYLDHLTSQARITRAVNTLFWEKESLWGENTDCSGFADSLRHQNIIPQSAFILGAGGAAAACITGLRSLGVDNISVTTRNRQKLKELRSHFRVQTVSWEKRGEITADVLINATPLGMQGGWEQQTPVEEKDLGNFPVVYDLVYNPLQTKLLVLASSKGCRSISGMDMFVHQALSQFRLWTGQELDINKSLNLIQDALLQGSG